jgi:general secretion pathway protein D
MKRMALAVLLLVGFCAPTMAAQTPGGPANPPGTHTLNLKDADIQVLIATVSEITGKNFIVGPNVAGKVTVVSARPMQADEIYDVFLSVLRVHGYAAVPSGSMIKIVAEAMAQQDGSAALNGNGAHASDELITQIVPVKHIPAAELVQILRPLMPQGGQLVPHAASNSLVISDRAGNVQRLVGIIQRIDTVSDAEIEVIPLRHASAAEMARTLTQLNDNKDATAEQSKVFADERTNSILLAGGKSNRLKLRALITHLDTPLESGGDTQVFYLNYANAKDLVPILQGVASTLSGEGPPAKPAAGAAANPATAGQGSVTIQAHEETNALVISASPAIFRSLANVIRSLDVRRAQVLIEAVIAEVSTDAASEIGVQWQAPFKKNADGSIRDSVIGGTNFTGTNGTGNIITAGGPNGLSTLGQGLNLGYINGTITLPGSNVPLLEIGALVRALKTDGRSNVLSTPSVLTLDNQEAIIKVAQEVPFITGQYTNTSTNGGTNQPTNPFQTVQRKDVGLTLTVTPHINAGDSVRLDIHQEVSALIPTPAGAVDLVTSKRELQTRVLVADNALLVLGGLTSDGVADGVSKVPALGDIPLLGNLFRSRNSTRTKRDLMVFLHPKILRDAASEASVSSEKYNYIRTEQLHARDNPAAMTPRGDQPLLPENHDFLAQPREPASAPRRNDPPRGEPRKNAAAGAPPASRTVAALTPDYERAALETPALANGDMLAPNAALPQPLATTSPIASTDIAVPAASNKTPAAAKNTTTVKPKAKPRTAAAKRAAAAKAAAARKNAAAAKSQTPVAKPESAGDNDGAAQ